LTEENKRRNIAEELERAEECLKEAEALHEKGLETGAVSRLYYHVFHLVRALLLSKALEPKTHEETARLLSMYFIKPGVLDTGVSHFFTKLMKYREEADYNPSYVFTGDDYRQFRVEAERLRDTIQQYLTKSGF